VNGPLLAGGKSVRIGLLNGGLGNQLFQYIFVRFAERYSPGETWYFDDSYFFINPCFNGYELEKIWGIKANLLSNYFDSDVWEEIIRLKKAGTSLPQIFLDMGLPLSMVAETSDYSFNGRILQLPANKFHPEIINLTDGNNNIYYHGYWINKHWFAQYCDENRSELAFPALIGEENIRYAEQINNCLSVGVHIRRGDFVTIGWALPMEYYPVACKSIVDAHPDCRFFVFSDDMDWCKANAEALGLNLAPHTVYVTGNSGERSYIDAQLLSMCQGIIMSNSSFCYFATLMDKNLKFWVNPTRREV